MHYRCLFSETRFLVLIRSWPSVLSIEESQRPRLRPETDTHRNSIDKTDLCKLICYITKLCLNQPNNQYEIWATNHVRQVSWHRLFRCNDKYSDDQKSVNSNFAFASHVQQHFADTNAIFINTWTSEILRIHQSFNKEETSNSSY